MNIVVCEAELSEQRAFAKLQQEHHVRFVDEPFTQKNASRFSDADVVSTALDSIVSSEALRPLDHVRLIAVRATGVDNVDLGYCQEHGIAVANVPAYAKQTVAEHTFALLLAISHRLIEAVERTRRGEFSPIGLEGFDLCGKTMGVIGAGAIGSAVIRIAKGFGMNVLAFEARPKPQRARELGFRFVEFEELLKQSDVVSLHLPLTPQTRNIIGREQIAMMKPGAVLLNTSRGALIDAPALVEALRSGRLRAAGLDVLPEEPSFRDEIELLRRAFHEEHDLRNLLAGELLLKLPNAIVTPHSAFNTTEAVGRILDTTVNNILAFARGKPEDIVSH